MFISFHGCSRQNQKGFHGCRAKTKRASTCGTSAWRRCMATGFSMFFAIAKRRCGFYSKLAGRHSACASHNGNCTQNMTQQIIGQQAAGRRQQGFILDDNDTHSQHSPALPYPNVFCNPRFDRGILEQQGVALARIPLRNKTRREHVEDGLHSSSRAKATRSRATWAFPQSAGHLGMYLTAPNWNRLRATRPLRKPSQQTIDSRRVAHDLHRKLKTASEVRRAATFNSRRSSNAAIPSRDSRFLLTFSSRETKQTRNVQYEEARIPEVALFGISKH